MKDALERDDGNDRDMLAAEYVLGVLEPSQRQFANRLIAQEPEFSRLVEAWGNHLAQLDGEFLEKRPPEHLKTAIEDRLFATTSPAARRSGVSSFWRPLALVTTALLLLLGGLYAYDMSRLIPVAGDRLVATLSSDGNEFSAVVLIDAGSRELLVTPVKAEIAEDRDLELWLIRDGAAPAPIGLVATGAPSRLPISPQAARQILDGDTFALSIEPKGGSPTGQPTGPVVAAGKVKKI